MTQIVQGGFIRSDKIEFDVDVILVPNGDVILNKLDHVVTSDGITLKTCNSWINLAYEIVSENLPNTSYVDFQINHKNNLLNNLLY